jgi:asparagine synthase (glutamine-hydrolysing)
MPGIVGLITSAPREWAEQQLRAMVELIRHESFYRTGTWRDESLGVYVGWSVQENSFSDGMPVRNERGDAVLVFSGEEYPEPGTVEKIKEQGHDLEPKGSAYVLHLYEENSKFPSCLNGRFHGLIADRRSASVTLFNDRYGMHRINYAETKEAFYFAAEAKAILNVRPELREPNFKSIGEFIACGCVLENRTLFAGIHVFPPAGLWKFQRGTIESKTTYFSPQEWEDQTRLSPESYYQELRQAFARNLPRYFSGQQPIAMSLTGGFDTRMIMAWKGAQPGTLPCYTWGGMFRDCQDVLVARQVASLCKQSHDVIEVGNEFLSHFSHYAERSVYLSDGCVDVSRCPDLYVNQRARQIAPVRMTGLYGDEVLRHLRAFKPKPPKAELFHPELLSHIRHTESTYAGLVRDHPLSFAVFRQAPWYHYGSLALEGTQLTMRTPYLDNDLVRTVFRAPQSSTASNDVRLRLIEDGDKNLRRIRTDRGFGGNHGWLLGMVMRQFLEFTFKAEYAYDYGMPQWLARIDHFLSPFHLERLFLGRHKVYHFRIWYRDALSKYVQEILLDTRTLSRPYLEESEVEAVVKGHLSGKRNFTNEIHKLLTLELVHRLFFDPK